MVWAKTIRESDSSRTGVKILSGQFVGQVGLVMKYGHCAADRREYYQLKIVGSDASRKFVVIPSSDCKLHSNAGVPIVFPSGWDERTVSPIRNGAGAGSRQGLRSCLPSAGDYVCAEYIWYVNCFMCVAGQKFA